MIRAVAGANWGDEGKGKMTDIFAKESDYIVRFQGGSNAGHTIINEYGKFALHLLPSGVFYDHAVNILGPGVAVNIEILLKELDELKSKASIEPNLLISERAQVIMPWHLLFDRWEEERLASRSFGSTKSGIAPFYSDKYLKIGIQVSDLFFPGILKEKINEITSVKNIIAKSLYNKEPFNSEEIYSKYIKLGSLIEQYTADTTTLLNKAALEKKNILLEGQLGALKDPDLGIYPSTTSSSPLAGFASVGAGILLKGECEVIAVAKAYSSCVGAGPFVTEIFGEEASTLRERGGDAGEYGATTGRPRRMGWFDAVATKYGCMVQGADTAALTLLDVPGYLDEIPVCVAYDTPKGITKDFPVTNMLYNSKPVYEKLPGWKCDVRGIRKYKDLPDNAKKYVDFIEDFIGVPIKYISNGPKREDIILDRL